MQISSIIQSTKRCIVASIMLGGSLFSFSGYAGIQFTDVTEQSGINYTGESWGSSWGDFNGDGLPDLWMSNHIECPSLYLNNGDGSFSDIRDQVILDDLCDHKWLDAHGAAWADFDNDGDQDLIQLFDAAPTLQLRANRLYVNEGGKFVNMATEFGVENSRNRGRMPTWVDYDLDGLLDLIIPTSYTNLSQVPTKIFKQTNNAFFTDVTQEVGFILDGSTNTVQLNDIDGDGKIELLPEVTNRFPVGVFDTSTIPFTDKQDVALPITNQVRDAVIGDFNGDLLNDIFMVTGEKQNDIVIFDDYTIRARLSTKNAEMGFEFVAGDEITVSVNPAWRWSKANIYIGSSGENPPAKVFTLSRYSPSSIGFPSYTSGESRGLFVGYDEVRQVWVLRVSNYSSVNLVVSSNSAISNMIPYGVNLSLGDVPNTYLVNHNGFFLEETINTGFSVPASGRDVISADFDNDMDLDIYIVSTGAVNNLPNILYENLGDGTFIKVLDTGGAAGTSVLGRGDTVSTVDYNLDGFIDLLVTNGKSKKPFDTDGPVQIFKNMGNDNNWIQLDLEGVKSNRDGIGAKVIAVAGGVEQIRYQTGGVHYRTQNHSRIHFGLAENTEVDLIISWPSGIEQRLFGIKANQVVNVIEPVEADLLGIPNSTSISSESGVMLWKDSFDGPYKIRVKGGGDKTKFTVKLLSTKNFYSLSTSALEGDDIFSSTASSFSLDANVSIGDERLEFMLPGGAKALLAVDSFGLVNPRQIKVGTDGDPLSPAGWIYSYSKMPILPSVYGGRSNSQYFGRKNDGGSFSIRLNSDKIPRYSAATVIFSEEIISSAGVNVEANDSIQLESKFVHINGKVSFWWDGVDVISNSAGVVGVAALHEGLFQPKRVNPAEGSLSEPNAYWLPLAEPYGEPKYELGIESGIYLWKNKQGAWSLRVSAVQNYRVSGTIYASSPFVNVTLKHAENGDFVDQSVEGEIRFNFDTRLGDEDELSFLLPSDAIVGFDLDLPGNHRRLLRVGAAKWTVETLPLDLSGWE